MNQSNDTTRRVFLMSLPIFAELLLQLLVGNVDQIMVSRYAQSSVAAIGNGNQLISLVIILLNAMSAATTILLSQSLGARDSKRAAEVCNASVVILGLSSLLATALLIGFHRPLFVWLRVSEEVMAEACAYTVLVGSFTLVQGLYMTFTAILRSYSMLREVMLASLVMNGVNIFGNALLINGMFGLPALGVVGAAISTNLSKCVGLALVMLLYRKKIGVPLSIFRARAFSRAVSKRLLFFALPSGAESLSYNLSQTFIMRFVNLFGTSVVATKIYCTTLANIAYVYSVAISQATQIMVGYLIGEGRIDRVRRRVWAAVGMSIAVSLSVTLLLYLSSDFVFGIFTEDPVVHALGRKILMVEFFLEIGRSINIVMVRCLVAAGDVELPVASGIASGWLVAVALSWLFGVHWGGGLVGIWIAMATDECLRGLIFSIRFYSGAWKKRIHTEAP